MNKPQKTTLRLDIFQGPAKCLSSFAIPFGRAEERVAAGWARSGKYMEILLSGSHVKVEIVLKGGCASHNKNNCERKIGILSLAEDGVRTRFGIF